MRAVDGSKESIEAIREEYAADRAYWLQQWAEAKDSISSFFSGLMTFLAFMIVIAISVGFVKLIWTIL
jgi:hypothetical protein